MLTPFPPWRNNDEREFVTEILCEEPNPTGSRPSDLIRHLGWYLKLNKKTDIKSRTLLHSLSYHHHEGPST